MVKRQLKQQNRITRCQLSYVLGKDKYQKNSSTPKNSVIECSFSNILSKIKSFLDPSQLLTKSIVYFSLSIEKNISIFGQK